MPTTVDLFCGAGGLTEGFRQAGFDCLVGADADRHAMATFRRNHPEAMSLLGPIEELDAGEVRSTTGLAPGELDVLLGGPPCQGFSVNAHGRRADDPRNGMFRQFAKFLVEFEPRFFVFENVPGMLSLNGGEVVATALETFRGCGYTIALRVLLAAHYGVPQERWRLIMLGSRLGSAPCHPKPEYAATARMNFAGAGRLTFRLDPHEPSTRKSAVTVAEALGDLPALGPGEGADAQPYRCAPHSAYALTMRSGSEIVQNHVAPKLAEVNRERLRHLQPGSDWRGIPFELLPKGMQRADRSDHTRRYGRLRADGLAGTVLTKMDPHWGQAFHYEQERTLTVREAARLQSFPDRYVFEGPRASQYRQVGNAVPVLMARAIATAVKDALGTLPEAVAEARDTAAGAAPAGGQQGIG